MEHMLNPPCYAYDEAQMMSGREIYYFVPDAANLRQRCIFTCSQVIESLQFPVNVSEVWVFKKFAEAFSEAVLSVNKGFLIQEARDSGVVELSVEVSAINYLVLVAALKADCLICHDYMRRPAEFFAEYIQIDIKELQPD